MAAVNCIHYTFAAPLFIIPIFPFPYLPSPRVADIYTLQECVSLAFNVKDLKDQLSYAGRPAAESLTYIKK